MVTQRSAKPRCAGSIPARASRMMRMHHTAGIESRSYVQSADWTARRGHGNFRATARKLSVTNPSRASREKMYYDRALPRWRNGRRTLKLIVRLFKAGLKKAGCEECGWAKLSADGRIPVELDHINGDRYDNRIENLRILCPNCHSLKSTHRGRNKMRRRGGEIGRRATLKTL